MYRFYLLLSSKFDIFRSKCIDFTAPTPQPPPARTPISLPQLCADYAQAMRRLCAEITIMIWTIQTFEKKVWPAGQLRLDNPASLETNT